jgi:phosphoglycolate phosphatase-like HAD superfamily hydrolase
MAIGEWSSVVCSSVLLMELYLALDPFPEVPAVVGALRQAGFRTAILS